MPMEETKECSGCKNRFKVSALKNGLCSVCVGLPPQAEEDKTKRIVSSETIREADVVRIVKETVPTRDQIEMMIKKIVKEELGELPTTATGTVDSKERIVFKPAKTRVFKPINCIKCGNSFIPRIGFQKICDNCRTKAKETK